MVSIIALPTVKTFIHVLHKEDGHTVAAHLWFPQTAVSRNGAPSNLQNFNRSDKKMRRPGTNQ